MVKTPQTTPRVSGKPTMKSVARLIKKICLYQRGSSIMNKFICPEVDG